jgi:hypothetical protein
MELRGYRRYLPWARRTFIPFIQRLRVCIDNDHLLIVFLPDTLKPLCNDLRHMRLVLSQVLIVHKLCPIEVFDCCRIFI